MVAVLRWCDRSCHHSVICDYAICAERLIEATSKLGWAEFCHYYS
ncbi:hypothetical protein GV51_0324 [Gardnerella vaginalis 5-1]|nr:hypothetical protein GV51_0324 [Gardnerella vaginalis 5-1]